MTRHDLTQSMTKYWPILVTAATLATSGVVAWTKAEARIDTKLDAARYERDSINVWHSLGDHQREIMEMRAQQQTLESICRAVRCRVP